MQGVIAIMKNALRHQGVRRQKSRRCNLAISTELVNANFAQCRMPLWLQRIVKKRTHGSFECGEAKTISPC